MLYIVLCKILDTIIPTALSKSIFLLLNILFTNKKIKFPKKDEMETKER